MTNVIRGTAAGHELLTPDEVAARVKRSRDWVMNRIHAGELPAYNLGGKGAQARYSVKPADLRAFIENRRYRP